MEQRIIKDFILGKGQQIFMGILLLGAIIASSILILRRVNEEKGNIKVSKGEFPKNSPRSLVHGTQTIVHGTQTIKNRAQQARLMININKANKDGLIKLPGIGPKLADRILEYRKKNGPFYKKEDIMKVSGIGLKKFEKCKEMITID